MHPKEALWATAVTLLLTTTAALVIAHAFGTALADIVAILLAGLEGGS